MNGKYYRIPTKLIFRGYFDIEADSKEEATKIMREQCDLTITSKVFSKSVKGVRCKFEPRADKVGSVSYVRIIKNPTKNESRRVLPIG